METNYRVYAYTDSSLQLALLGLFSEMMYRYGSTLYTPVQVRTSVQSALFTLEQVRTSDLHCNLLYMFGLVYTLMHGYILVYCTLYSLHTFK